MGPATVVASLLIKLGLDPKGVEEGVAKADASLRGLGKTALKGAGVIAAGALGVAAKGALEAEDAMARFRAETGATEQEARRTFDSINAMAGQTTVSFDQIADSATKIRTDLGLTGAEAEKATAQFIRYQTATRQGAESVLAFDDILDAWNLEATDAAGIMDVLIVSHQKYGGSIADNQRILADLAPTLQAANMSWEEGQGLLNLFARAGVSGEAATTAFNRALTKVKSPEELQALLETISREPDAFKRATLAAETFGARAGTKLGQALGDANGDLTQFMVTTEEAAGATKEAADAIEGTWGAFFKRTMNLASSALRGFGMELGPVLTGLASLATLGQSLGFAKWFPTDKVTGLIKTGLKSVWRTILPAAVAGAAEVGAAQGAAMAGAEGAGGLIGSLGSSLKRVNWKRLLAGAGLAIGGVLLTEATKNMDAPAAAAGAAGGAAMEIAAAFAIGGPVLAGIAAVTLAVKSLFEFMEKVGAAQAALQEKVDSAVNQSAQEAIKNLSGLSAKLASLQGFDRLLADTFGGAQEVEGLRNLGTAIVKAKTLSVAEATEAIDALTKGVAEAEARGNKGIADELRGMITTVEGYREQAASATDGLYHGVEEAAAEGGDAAAGAMDGATNKVKSAQRRLREAIAGGASKMSAAWDAVSQAMAKGPKLMSFDDRMAEFAKAARRAYNQMRRAVAAGDPVNASYWAEQYQNVRASQWRMKHDTEKTMGDVGTVLGQARARYRRHHRGITRDVEKEGRKQARASARSAEKTANATPKEMTAAEPKVQAAAEDTATAVKTPLTEAAMDATTWGTNLGANFASGISSQYGAAAAAAASLAEAVHSRIGFSAPPKKGALRTIDKWGQHLVMRWVKPIHRDAGKAEKAGRDLADRMDKGMGHGKGRHRGGGSGWSGSMRVRRLEAQHLVVRGGGRGAGGGDVHIHVGALIANDAGIDALQKRLDRRLKLRRRDRHPVPQTTGR